MQSVDEFTPSTTEPVFGSGLITQSKSQSSTNNDATENEKVAASSEPMTNGETNSVTPKDNTNDSKEELVAEKTDAAVDSKVEHVNGTSEQSNKVEPPAVSNEPEPMLVTPADTTNEGSSSATPTIVETKTDDVAPEVPAVAEAIATTTTEPKSKASRGRAKASAVSPARQSTRGRKATPTSSINAEENQTIDDDVAPPPPPPPPTTTTTQLETSKRTKRQAATIAKDAITASNQPNSTSGSSIADDGNDEDAILSDDDDDDITDGKTKRSASSGRRKRGASTSPASAAKKAKKSNNFNDETKTPRKARISVTKKTPEQPSEEYVRKLRPRK